MRNLLGGAIVKSEALGDVLFEHRAVATGQLDKADDVGRRARDPAGLADWRQAIAFTADDQGRYGQTVQVEIPRPQCVDEHLRAAAAPRR